MRLSLERTTVVLLGAWNQAIFTPEWVARTLFPDEDEVSTMVGMLSTGSLATQFSGGGVQLQVVPGRLEFRFLAFPIDCARIEKLARDCLDRLPQTPVQAFGMNAGFDVDSPSENLLRLTSLDDEQQLSMFGTLSKRAVLRELRRDDNTKLRVRLTRSDEGFQLNLNLHKQVDADALRASELFTEGTIRRALDEFKRLLIDVYSLETQHDL